MKGLHEVVVGARIKAFEAVLQRVAGREDDDGDVATGAQFREHRHAVELRESQVKEYELVLGRGGKREGRKPVRRTVDDVGQVAKGGLGGVADHRVVFNEENAHGEYPLEE